MSLPSLPPDVMDALRKGHKIEAIKRLRETTKIGLAEAKAVVDALEKAQVGASKPKAPVSAAQVASGRHLGPGEVPRSSSSGAAAVVMIVLAALGAWYFLR